MPSAPGTEQIRRAFRNVLHLLTRQQCPPSSFCKLETHSSHESTSTVWVRPMTDKMFQKHVQTNYTGSVVIGPIWIKISSVFQLGSSTWEVSQLLTTAEVKNQVPGQWFIGWNLTHFTESKWFATLEEIHFVSIFISCNMEFGRIRWKGNMF